MIQSTVRLSSKLSQCQKEKLDRERKLTSRKNVSVVFDRHFWNVHWLIDRVMQQWWVICTFKKNYTRGKFADHCSQYLAIYPVLPIDLGLPLAETIPVSLVIMAVTKMLTGQLLLYQLYSYSLMLMAERGKEATAGKRVEGLFYINE